MSQYKNDAPAAQGRDDVEPLPNRFFSRWLDSTGSMAAEGGAALFGANLQSVMPQAHSDASGPKTTVPTNPVEKFLKGLKIWLKKRISPQPGVKNGSPQALSRSSAPETNVPTNPIEK